MICFLVQQFRSRLTLTVEHSCRPVPRNLGHLPGPDVPGSLASGRYQGLPALQAQMSAINEAVKDTLEAKKQSNAQARPLRPLPLS